MTTVKQITPNAFAIELADDHMHLLNRVCWANHIVPSVVLLTLLVQFFDQSPDFILPEVHHGNTLAPE